MRNFLRLTDYTAKDVYEIFSVADSIQDKAYADILKGKTVVLFFPSSSIRTRVSFEKGIYLLGGQSILFPTEALDKKEALEDVCGYLNNWADMVIVRHKSMEVVEELSRHLTIPVINAMTDVSHPCEILSDMYALSKIRRNFVKDKYLFCGMKGNIGLTWKEASKVMGFDLEQCCARGYEIEGLLAHNDIKEAIIDKDIVCTDSLPEKLLAAFAECKVTRTVMDMANENALLNPCPPFYRGEEVSEDVICSKYFVGYEFKQSLLKVQQAVMIYCFVN